jgi:hypothetical protein
MSATAVARGVIALVAFGFLIAQPASANDAAHKMAEKFAGPSKGTKKEPAPAKAEDKKQAEAGKKAQADTQDATAAEAKKKKEAERKAAEAKKRAAEDARRKEAQKKAEAQRRAAMAEEAKRRAVEEKKAEEAEMLARARREVEEMRGAEEQTRLAEEARRLIEEAGKERARAEALLAEQTEQARSKEVEEAQLAQRRLEETKALAEKLKRVRQIREARLAAQGQKEKDKGPTEPQEKGPVAAAPPPQVATVEQREPAPERTEAAQGTPVAPVATPSAQAAEPAPPVVAALPTPPAPAATPESPAAPTAKVEETAARLPPPVPPASTEPAKAPPPATEKRVTVLLVLEPGTYGIRRRGPRTADPLLCTPPDGCYVSAGADRPATFLHGRKALGFGNTMGNRAGACRNSLGCVFRDVELAEMPGYLQPVDLHILKHDRRRPQAILGDSSCRSEAGRLSCTRGIYAEDYVMWIVPESLADAVGPAVLEQAVNEGLIGPRSAELYSRR